MKLLCGIGLFLFSLSVKGQSQVNADCAVAIPLCSNPSFTFHASQGIGSVSDLPPIGSVSNPNINPASTNMGCLLSGELKPQWLLITIGSPGTLEFLFGRAGSQNPQTGYYDWAMWPYSHNTCADIKNNLLPPIRCNWNFSSVGGTGLASQAHIPAGGHTGNYEPPLTVLGCQQFIICFSNYSSVNALISFENIGTAALSCDPYCLIVTGDTICTGKTASVTLSNSLALVSTSYSLEPGAITSPSPAFVVTPTITTTYTFYASGINSINMPVTQAGTVVVVVNQIPEIDILPDSAIVCIGDSVDLYTDGTGSTYTWSPGTWLNTTLGKHVITKPVSSLTYTVNTELNKCYTSDSVKVTVLPLPIPSLSISKTRVCTNDSVSLSGGGGIHYSWTGPGNFSQGGREVTFCAGSPAYSGTYTLVISDGNGCVSYSTTSLVVDNLPFAYLLGSKIKGCVPFCADFNFYSHLSAVTLGETRLETVNLLFSTNSFSHCFKEAGFYTFRSWFKDTISQCANTTTLTVEAYPLPEAMFDYAPLKPIENTEEVIFTNSSQGDHITKYNWFFINDQGYSTERKNASYLFKETGIFPVALVVTNTWGCSDSIVKTVEVDGDFSLFVPNAFSPNEDGLNEQFQPVGRNARLYHLSVYNRWGTMIFKSAALEEGWDGSYRGLPCPEGVYAWKISVSSFHGESRELKGHVTLYR